MSGSASRALPERPSLEQLHKQAKDFLRAWRAGDAATIERARAHKPNVVAPALANAQFVLAREYGFPSWPALVHHIEGLRSRTVDHHGLSTKPPFYRIDWVTNPIEPRQPLAPDDWRTIADVIRERGLTGLNAGGQMTDDALAQIARVEGITRLLLGGSKAVTDDGLAHLARMPQLEELELAGRITDRGLDVFQKLPELRQFAIYWHAGISDTGVANLSFCDKLERVDLLGSTTGDGAINALRGKRHLRHLKTGRLVTDAGISLLHDIPHFKRWHNADIRYDLMTFGDADPNSLVLDGPMTDAGLARLAGLDGLFGLSFFWHATHLTPHGLGPLRDLPNLGALGCEGALCDDAAMRHIASIPRLRMLMAQGTVASDAGFVALSQSPTLEYLWGRECPNLRGRGFAALAALPHLAGLAVSCRLVDDAALSSLPDFPALTWLLPMDVSDSGFRHVGRCTNLEKLTCMYCRDTGDAATEHLTGLTRLSHYYAGQTQITDRSLEVLGGMTSLEDVQLSGCTGISDAGLVYLVRLPRLKHVSVDATALVTRAGLGVFPKHVKVDFWS